MLMITYFAFTTSLLVFLSSILSSLAKGYRAQKTFSEVLALLIQSTEAKSSQWLALPYNLAPVL